MDDDYVNIHVRKTNKGNVMLIIIDEGTGQATRIILSPKRARKIATDLTLQSIIAEEKHHE